MADTRQDPSDPGQVRRQIALSREQRDWINAAAAALEQHADHDEDPPAMLDAAAELRSVVAGWDGATDVEPVETGPERLRAALRQIADAESGIWGSIARAALDDRGAPRDMAGDGNGGAASSAGGDGGTDPHGTFTGSPTTTAGHGPDSPPSMLDRAVLKALLRRPADYLRDLVGEAERRRQPDLARLARQVLAWRASQRG